MAKSFAQVRAMEALGATAGTIAAAIGPQWLEQQLGGNWDLTSGWREPATTLVIALGGGLIIGRWIDKNAARAWAIAGVAVAIINQRAKYSGQPWIV